MPERDLFGEVPAPAPRPERPRKATVQPRHTWFFALRPSVPDAVSIAAFAQDLLAAKGVSGKPIDAQRLHVTLELVGHDVGAECLERACQAADSVKHASVDVRFDAAMTFAAPSGPFVLLGDSGLDGVRELRTALACAMADKGFTSSRSYEPHMTLGYDPQHRVARFPLAAMGFRGAEFCLIKSHIGLSRHEVLRRWQLAE